VSADDPHGAHGADDARDRHDDEGVHGPQPLHDVDPAPLHAAVDALTAALHEYIGTAVGVRAEFGATEADEDPRVLALEGRIGVLNADLYDVLHRTLGLHADLTTLSWPGDGETPGDSDPDAPPSAPDLEAFHLGFVVSPPQGASDASLESVLDLLDQGGEQIVTRLTDAGFDVVEWATSRGEPADFDGFGDDEEDEP